ncbi:MAG: helix-turn-helix transcriptional regulator [Hymenobacter sp.]
MSSATFIIEARRSRGWSQEALAEHANLSLRTIQRVEQGESVPRGHTMQQLAHALGVSLDIPLQCPRQQRYRRTQFQ